MNLQIKARFVLKKKKFELKSFDDKCVWFKIKKHSLFFYVKKVDKQICLSTSLTSQNWTISGSDSAENK